MDVKNLTDLFDCEEFWQGWPINIFGRLTPKQSWFSFFAALGEKIHYFDEIALTKG
jgi:hypothetical protein